jgi:hypothetical protein
LTILLTANRFRLICTVGSFSLAHLGQERAAQGASDA